MRSFFHWLFARLIVDEEPPDFEAGAIVTRAGEVQSNGFSEWKVVVQLRHPTTDYDAVYAARWVSKTPPDVSEIVRHYGARPQDFTFLDFLPNTKKQPQ